MEAINQAFSFRASYLVFGMDGVNVVVHWNVEQSEDFGTHRSKRNMCPQSHPFTTFLSWSEYGQTWLYWSDLRDVGCLDSSDRVTVDSLQNRQRKAQGSAITGDADPRVRHAENMGYTQRPILNLPICLCPPLPRWPTVVLQVASAPSRTVNLNPRHRSPSVSHSRA
jgi:hypothetical protein